MQNTNIANNNKNMFLVRCMFGTSECSKCKMQMSDKIVESVCGVNGN